MGECKEIPFLRALSHIESLAFLDYLADSTGYSVDKRVVESVTIGQNSSFEITGNIRKCLDDKVFRAGYHFGEQNKFVVKGVSDNDLLSDIETAVRSFDPDKVIVEERDGRGYFYIGKMKR